MPSQDISEVLNTKPVSFTIKTTGGRWKCQLHSDRTHYERARTSEPVLPRTDSELSTGSASSSTTKASH